VRLVALLSLFALLATGVLRQPLLAVLLAVTVPLFLLWRAQVVQVRNSANRC
jgi:hypothetical protein